MNTLFPRPSLDFSSPKDILLLSVRNQETNVEEKNTTEAHHLLFRSKKYQHHMINIFSSLETQFTNKYVLVPYSTLQYRHVSQNNFLASNLRQCLGKRYQPRSNRLCADGFPENKIKLTICIQQRNAIPCGT